MGWVTRRRGAALCHPGASSRVSAAQARLGWGCGGAMPARLGGWGANPLRNAPSKGRGDACTAWAQAALGFRAAAALEQRQGQMAAGPAPAACRSFGCARQPCPGRGRCRPPGTAPRTPEAPRGGATAGLVLRAGTWGLPSAQPVGASLGGRGRGAPSCSPSIFPAAHQTHGCPAGCSDGDVGCAGSGQRMGRLPAAENTRKAVRVCGGAGAGCVPRRGLGVGRGSGASACLQSPHFAPL